MHSAGYHEKMIGRTYVGGDQVTQLNLVLYNTIKWPYQPKHSPSITMTVQIATFCILVSDIFQVYVNPEDIKFASRSGKLKPNLNDADVERVKR